VNSAADPGDGICDAAECTLREAIDAANGQTGTDLITFAIPGAGPFVIHLSYDLPTITDPVVIDGATQPGYSGAPLIEIDGSAVGSGGNGLDIVAGGSTIRALSVGGFGFGGIGISGPGGNVIVGNYLGVDVTGAILRPNGFSGVFVNDSANNQIGGSAPADRNVISANSFAGVVLSGHDAHHNQVQGNYIGTNAAGTTPLGNGAGIGMFNGASNALIGGVASGTGNVIAANAGDGISFGGSCCNTIQGNYIGTNAPGASGLGNGGNGIFVNFGSANTIGGTAAGARNVISGNGANGIFITSNFLSNTVQGNYIGVDPTGSRDLGNGQEGIHVSGGNGNLIGGTSIGAGNVISGNGSHGVSLTDGTRGNVIQQNRIGTDANGAASIRNDNNGVVLASAIDSLIGGTASNAGNLISGNGTNGILLTAATTRTTIAGNFIGTDLAGAAALPNTFAGIAVSGGSTTTEIGGTIAGARNVVSGNTQGGVNVQSGSGTIVEGNFVGTNAAGTAAVPNRTNGIIISSGGTTIGGATAGARNVISGNEVNGVLLNGAGASGSVVQGNYIGLNAPGTLALGNGSFGIRVQGTSNSLIGGTTSGTANSIMFNAGAGVGVVSSAGTPSGIAIEGNSIASNGALGVDLSDDGVTPNDLRDPDTGPNGLQNFPVVTSAKSLGAVGTIRGRLNSTANTTFRVEVFASSSCDLSGFGEGQTYLGSTEVTTNASGNGTFAVDGTFAVGAFITATATSPNGSSSEFGKCVQAKDATDSADDGNQ
jgi:titin